MSNVSSFRVTENRFRCLAEVIARDVLVLVNAIAVNGLFRCTTLSIFRGTRFSDFESLQRDPGACYLGGKMAALRRGIFAWISCAGVLHCMVLSSHFQSFVLYD